MKKEIETLIRALFKDKNLLTTIGFSKLESEVLHYLIHGNSISKIAEQLDVSYRTIANIKNRRFHLIPIFIQRKLNHLTKFDLSKINTKLVELDQLIAEYMVYFERVQVYEIQELDLSKRTINSLIASNIRNTNDLKSLSREELLLVKNIGHKAVTEISTELSRLNLSLKS